MDAQTESIKQDLLAMIPPEKHAMAIAFFNNGFHAGFREGLERAERIWNQPLAWPEVKP